MKKFLLRIFACGIAATLLLTFTACNSGEKPSTASSSPVVSAAEEGTSSEEEQDSGASQTGATGKYETIAAFLGIQQTTYSKYELGKINIPIEVFIKLADYYDVSVDYLLGRTTQKKWK